MAQGEKLQDLDSEICLGCTQLGLNCCQPASFGPCFVQLHTHTGEKKSGPVLFHSSVAIPFSAPLLSLAAPTGRASGSPWPGCSSGASPATRTLQVRSPVPPFPSNLSPPLHFTSCFAKPYTKNHGVCLLSSDLTMYLSAKFDLLQKKNYRVYVYAHVLFWVRPLIQVK